jgi:hypothetical protein
VMGRRERRCKQLLDYLEGTRRCWKVKWEAGSGRGYEPLVRHNEMKMIMMKIMTICHISETVGVQMTLNIQTVRLYSRVLTHLLNCLLF